MIGILQECPQSFLSDKTSPELQGALYHTDYWGMVMFIFHIFGIEVVGGARVVAGITTSFHDQAPRNKIVSLSGQSLNDRRNLKKGGGWGEKNLSRLVPILE